MVSSVANTFVPDLERYNGSLHHLPGKGKVLRDTIGTFIAINNQFQRVGLSRGVEHVTPTGALNMYLTYLRAQGAENSWTNNKGMAPLIRPFIFISLLDLSIILSDAG